MKSKAHLFISKALLWGVLASVCGQARADRDIVFSAQYYRWSGQFFTDTDGSRQETLTEKGYAHLYVINPDGSGRKRLTFGLEDDYDPLWSPDGKQLLFTRYRADRKVALCTMGASGGKVSTILVFPDEDHTQEMHYGWSPDGRTVAVAVTWYFRKPTENWLYLVDVKTHQIQKKLDISDFAWSPDNKKLYLSHITGSDQIVETQTGKSTPVTARLWNPAWIDNRNLIGSARQGQDFDFSDLYKLRGIDAQGYQRWQVDLQNFGHTKNVDYTFEMYPAAVSWYRLPQYGPSRLLVARKVWVSDGWHYASYLVDTRTGKWRFLRDGMVLGVAADRMHLAVARQEWVGPYKRGGERVGALKIVSLKTGKARAITSGLVTIEGGDWRGAGRM